MLAQRPEVVSLQTRPRPKPDERILLKAQAAATCFLYGGFGILVVLLYKQTWQ